MPAFTSRLNLYKPGDGVNISPDEAADIDKLNDNADIIDDAVGSKVVTSGTRPATPYSGQIIFETDTGDLRVRSGSSWVIANRSDRAVWNATDLDGLANVSVVNIVKDGDLCTVQEGGAVFARIAGAWVQVTPAKFATAAARDTAYAKASAAYKVDRAEAFITGSKMMSRYFATSARWFLVDPVRGGVKIPATAQGGTGTLNEDGSVTYTSVLATTGVYVDGIAVTEFRNTLISIELEFSGAAVPLFKFRTAGVDNALAKYDRQRHLLDNTTNSGVRQTAQNNIDMGVAATAGTHYVEVMVKNMASTVISRGEYKNDYTGAASMASVGGRNSGVFMHQDATAFDGVIITGSTGNITTARFDVLGWN